MTRRHLLPLAALLAGCNRGGRRVIGVVPKATSHLFFMAVHAGVKQAAEEFAFDIDWNGPQDETDHARQIQVVDAMVAQKVSALAISATDENTVAQAVQRAIDAGIPVSVFDSGVNAKGYLTFVATDNLAAGVTAAERLAALTNSKGKVGMVMHKPGGTSTMLREQGFEATMKKYPGLTIAARQYGMADRAKARAAAENMLTAHPDMAGLFASSEASSLGAMQAIESRGLSGKVKLITFDTSDSHVAALKAGTKLSRMLIVEGYMDVIALAQHGIGYSVATLGTATTAEHLEQLFRGAPEIVFCFDGDAAGQRASWRALEAALPLMHDGRTASFLFLPQGQDPDTLVRQEGKQAFETTDRFVGLSELLFKALEAQTDRRTLEGRARLVALAKPLIHKVPAGTFRQLLLERLVLLAQTKVDLPAGPRAPLPQAAARRSPLTNPRQRVLPVLSRALGLLLHQPALASLAEDFPALDVTSDPRLALLIDLLEFLREHPAITSGALVERFRDTPQMPLIDEILAPPVLASELWAAEFTGALQQILKHAQRNYFSRLIENSTTTPGDLGEQTRAKLQRMRHGESD